LKQKVVAGFLLALLILLIIGISSILQTKSFITATDRRAEIFLFAMAFEHLIFELDEVQTNMRGYVMTGDEKYRQEVEQMNKSIKMTRADIAARPSSADARKVALRALDSLIDSHLAFSAEVIRIRSTAGYGPADDLVKSGKGEEIMTAIRSLHDRLRNEDDALLEEMARNTSHIGTRTLWIVGLGSLMGLGIVAFSISSIVSELNQRMHAERELTERERAYRQLSGEFRTLLNAVPDRIYHLDRTFHVLWSNQGQPAGAAEDLQELCCYQLFEGSSAPCENCPVEESLKSGNPKTGVVTDKNGRIWELRAVPIKNPDTGEITVIELARDISERRKLEAQLIQAQKMEAVGQLAGGVAHDFNNILMAIMGYGNLLDIQVRQDEPLKDYIKQILAASEKAATLTRSLLAFSKKQVMSPKPVNLNEICLNIEKLIYRVIGDDIELQTIYHGGDLVVMGDSGQIEQVLLNLVNNARDAMPQGGLLIIETGTAYLDDEFMNIFGGSSPGMHAVLSVTDTGTGMDEATRARIFEPFFTTKEQGKGTGLGLAMVYGIIRQHNGFVHVYSELNRGATFKIYLPLISAKASAPAVTPEAIPLEGSEVILLAEDNHGVRELISTALAGFGYTVISAGDGEEALARFLENRERIDLALLDLIMPKMNGKEVYQKMLELKPSVKTIFMSGYTANLIHHKGILDEGLHFIQKPISLNDLLRKIRAVIES
jgi:signal transduction histidine kinase/CHASE3 domain sensor protein